MKEKIKELWLACEIGEDSYVTWMDNDLGRLEIIKDRINNLIELKNDLKEFQNRVKYHYYLCD